MYAHIFLSHINTKLAYHIVQALRDDHINHENPTMIVGALVGKHTGMGEGETFLHHAVNSVVEYEEQPLVFGKIVLESDVVVVDLREASLEAEYIVKLLEWDCATKTNRKPQTILTIGSYMTYAYPKPYSTPNWHPTPQSPSNPNLTPHPNYTHQRSLQDHLLSLNRYPSIHSCLLIPGLIYGKDFPSLQLETLLAKCWTLDQEIQVQGDGGNFVPLVSVEDVCGHVVELVGRGGSGGFGGVWEYFGVEGERVTQMKIIQHMLNNSGLIKVPKKTPQCPLISHPPTLSCNISLPANLVTQHSFLSYMQKYSPHPYFYFPLHNLIFYTQEFLAGQQQGQVQGQVQPQGQAQGQGQGQAQGNAGLVGTGGVGEGSYIEGVIHHLGTVIKVAKESQIVDDIMREKNIAVRADVDIHEIRREIEAKVLSKNVGRNYVIVLEHVLLDVDVVRNYSLMKLEPDIHIPALLQNKYPQYSPTCHPPIQPPHQPSQPSQPPQDPRSSTPCSYSSQNQISPSPSPCPSPSIFNNRCPASPSPQLIEQCQRWQQRQQQQKRMRQKQHRKIDQYLLDHVMGYLSEAFYRINTGYQQDKGCLQVKDLVRELRTIYDRETKVSGGLEPVL